MKTVHILIAALILLAAPPARAAGDVFTQAADAYRAGERREARALFNKAILLTPDKTEVFLGSAKLWLKAGELQQATDDAEEALRLAPSAEEPYCLLAHLKYLAGDEESARRLLDEATRRLPSSAALFYGRAVLYEEWGDFDRAAADYDTALRLYKKTPKRARKDSMTDFADCLNRPYFDKKGAALYLSIGLTQSKTGEFKKAWRALRRAVKIRPELSCYLPDDGEKAPVL